MNEKQAKLLRYFERASGDLTTAKAARVGWHTLSHKRKGKLTRWLKKVVVTMLHVKSETKKAQLSKNLEVLKGFSV